MNLLERLSAVSAQNKQILTEGLPDLPKPPPLAPMSESQQEAFDRIVKNRQHSCVFGPAGSGKSHVSKHLARHMDVRMTATTARAALMIGGCTVDRVFHFDRNGFKIRSWERLSQIMAATPRVVLIDEFSMAGSGMCRVLQQVAKEFDRQLVMVGDWAQAAPVLDGWATESELIQQAQMCRLRENHRQSNDEYLTALNDLRTGNLTPLARRVFGACTTDLGRVDETWIRGFATRKTAGQYNGQRLAAMPRSLKPVQLDSKFIDERDQGLQERYPIEPARIEKILEDVRFAHENQFKVGARIIMTFNDPQGRWVNGDAGELVDVLVLKGDALANVSEMTHSGWDPPVASRDVYALLVRLDRTGGVCEVNRSSQTMNDPFGIPEWTVQGFPIKLGWACTLHYAQGATLTKFVVDLGSITHMPGDSRHGLGYVALSRTRDLESLRIQNWDDAAFHCAAAIRPLI